MVSADRPEDPGTTTAPTAGRRHGRWARVSRLELAAAALVVVVMTGLVAIEPDILRAPFQNWRTLVFTFGGTALAAGALVAMVAGRVPPLLRIVVLGVPLVVVSWWLISPYFRDEEVRETFATSIAAARTTPQPGADAAPAVPTTATTSPAAAPITSPSSPSTVATPAPSPAGTPAPSGPVLLGAGRFEGLAGHDGTGDAGIFRLDGGAHVLRLEDLDLDNGPDLRLYLLPGADQVTPGDGAVYLGRLRGNVGSLTYDLPAGFLPAAGAWTVLVWCEAFDVEFVGATLSIG